MYLEQFDHQFNYAIFLFFFSMLGLVAYFYMTVHPVSVSSQEISSVAKASVAKELSQNYLIYDLQSIDIISRISS